MKTFRLHRRATAILAAALLIVPLNPMVAGATHFGFKGGFRGGFGHAGFGHSGFSRGFHRGFSGFHRGFGGFHGGFNRGFHRSGFRGFSGFHRSRFNSLAFRGPSFGFNRGFGGFNRGFRGGFNRGLAVRSGFGPRVVVSRGFASRGPVLINSRQAFGRPVLASRIVSGDGWQMLGRGEPLLAAQRFQSEIAQDTSAGVPKVGFALAAADAGDLDKGIWAMRRAFQADPGRVGDMMIEDSLRPVVARVTTKYETMANDRGIDRDSRFMMAALYQLQGDPEMASMAMDYAVGEDKGPGDAPGDQNLAKLIKQEMAAMPMASGRGWDLLVAGQPAAAHEAFVDAISQDPSAGEPKVGFALASAAAGDLDRGVWAMRRAFEIDPDHTADMMVSGKLRPMIEKITEAYEAADQDADAMFMLAALYQLQGDGEQAMHAVEESNKRFAAESGNNSLFRLVSTEAEMVEAMQSGDEYAIEQVSANNDAATPPLPDVVTAGSAPKPAPVLKPGRLEAADAHDYSLGPMRLKRPVTVVSPTRLFVTPVSACGRF